MLLMYVICIVELELASVMLSSPGDSSVTFHKHTRCGSVIWTLPNCTMVPCILQEQDAQGA